MTTLPPNLRRQLENAIKQARKIAEGGARKALEALAVHEPDPYRHMDEAQCDLRSKLRAQAKQLGDGESQTKRGAYEIKHLVEKLAYAQWHRLLFARFLLDNNLLISPEHGVSVSLDDCEELAPSLGLKDAWAVAARFAAKELPEIFRADDPAGAVELPVEDRKPLIQFVTELPVDVFIASDSLGWCYQFWQAERKDEVNATGNKIGADELPAVTQLFTEDYMVDFLLDNTLGAWHAGKVLATKPTLAESAQSEEELRNAVALPGCPWKYLRFIKLPLQVPRAEVPRASAEVPRASAKVLRASAEVPRASAKVLRASSSQSDYSPAIGLDESSLQIHQPRNLPHWTCDKAVYHVVFRLADSVPMHVQEAWSAERDSILALVKSQDRELTEEEQNRLRFLFSDKIEACLDGGQGHCWLKRPEIAAIVSGALEHFSGERYRLHAWCIMPNHVHVIVEPHHGHDLTKIVASWKSFSANEANKRLNLSGQFWMHDSYDHIIRSDKEFAFQINYVWGNPEKAGLKEVPRWTWEDKVQRPSCGEVRLPSWSPPTGGCEQDARSTLSLWAPAAGTFDGWPKTAEELKCLDPCMGSGHFVVAMFERLVALRMAEEKLDEAAAVAAVIRDNLFGLEIDPRCTQIGAFNLALAAWRRVGHCPLPAMNLACSGLAPNSREADWLAIAGDNGKLRNGMARLYQLFKDAPVLGSLINPQLSAENMFVADYHELQPLLERALAQETKADTAHEMAVTARGLAKAAEILASQFTLVATNVPYLGRGKQSDVLKAYCGRFHSEAKADLATCFVERCIDLCANGGHSSLVTPLNWWFLGSYRNLRHRLLTNTVWDYLVTLGEEAWQTFGDRGPVAALMGFTSLAPRDGGEIMGIDALPRHSIEAKIIELQAGSIRRLEQSAQHGNPDHRITIDQPISGSLLQDYASCLAGVLNGDSLKFQKCFWEFPFEPTDWVFQQTTVERTLNYSGRELLIFFDEENGHLREDADVRRDRLHNSDQRGNSVWKKRGVAVSQMRNLPATLYSGEKFDSNVAIISPRNQSFVTAIWTFCSSDVFAREVRRIDKKVNVTNASMVKVPFDLAHWQKVAAEKYPHGLPKPFSSDPTQWLFNGHPKGSDQPLHVAVARLLGYQWPRQTGSSFPDCPALGPDGLEMLADGDGIVCLSVTKGEMPAAERLRGLLVQALEKYDFSALIAAAGPKGSKSETLEEWLRDEFFEQHCALFHHRPFIWHAWDGHKSGFSALVNYHRFTHANLEKFTYAYLGDWIRRQQAAVDAGEAGSDARLAAAKQLQATLKRILEGEPPYDLFVRWKPLSKQAIGWHPDLNDGVRVNIRPFLAQDIPGGKKGAGILRTKPNIKWEKDRGKEPVRDKKDFPWFYNGSVFTGDRVNDVHLSREQKEKAKQ